MSNEPLNEVDVNTDNLDDFDALFSGRAVEAKSGNEEESTGSELENTEDDSLANEEQDEAEETEEDEDVTDSDEEETDEEEEPEEDTLKPSKKKTAQERINEITAARREAERKADMLEGRLAEMERRLNSDKSETKDDKPVAAPVEAEGALPDPEAKTEDGKDKYPLGEFDPAFIRDLTRATIAQEREADRAAFEKEQQEAKYKEAQAEVDKEWNTRIADAVETKENFVESVRNLEETFSTIEPQYGEYLANTIKQSDYGTEILYYLSQNLEEAQQIAGSGPTSATLALGRLEARFMSNDSEKTKPPANRVTKATSPPPKHTRGTGGTQRVAADTDDLDAFEKAFFK